jgi:hypothetical protein
MAPLNGEQKEKVKKRAEYKQASWDNSRLQAEAK